jgi:hypothetical protein
MWGSNVSHEQLLQKISLLAMLGPIREEPKGHCLVSREDKAYSLTVEQEREIITNLAFLSYRRKDSQNVTAICIKEDGDGQGLVVRLAVNGGAIAHVEEGLRRICEMLERASQRSKFRSKGLMISLTQRRKPRDGGNRNVLARHYHLGLLLYINTAEIRSKVCNCIIPYFSNSSNSP